MGGVRARLAYVLLVVAGFVATGALGYCSGRSAGKAAAQLERHTRALEAATEARKPIADAATRAVERVTAAEPRVRTARDLARIVGPTTLEVRITPGAAPQRLELPRVVVARMVEDSLHILRQRAAIDSLLRLRVADSLRATAADSVIRDLRAMKTPRCGAKCGAVITVAGITGVGIAAKNWRAILELLRLAR